MKKTIFFLILLLIPFFIINKKIQDSITQNGFELKENDVILIFGDSHGACSFNPQYIKNSKNYSNWGESLLFSYLKIKNIIKKNPERKDLKIILTFSFHTTYKCRENYNIPEQRGKILQEYYSYVEEKEFDIIKRTGVEYYLSKLKFDYGVPFSFKTNIEKFSNKKSFSTVGYINSIDDKNVTIKHGEQKIIDHFGDNPISNESEIMEIYLKKILKLTTDNNLPIYFVNTPKSKIYNNLLPKKVINRQQKLSAKLTQNVNSKIFYLDFSSLISDPKLFKDTDHLNSLGANIFSKKIDSIFN